MSTSKQELLRTQMSARNHHNSNGNGEPPIEGEYIVDEREYPEEEELVDREKIDGTPFYVERTKKEEGYYLRMGRHRLTLEKIETKEAALEYINYNMYDLLLKMILAVMQDKEEIENLKNQTI